MINETKTLGLLKHFYKWLSKNHAEEVSNFKAICSLANINYYSLSDPANTSVSIFIHCMKNYLSYFFKFMPDFLSYIAEIYPINYIMPIISEAFFDEGYLPVDCIIKLVAISAKTRRNFDPFFFWWSKREICVDDAERMLKEIMSVISLTHNEKNMFRKEFIAAKYRDCELNLKSDSLLQLLKDKSCITDSE